jgi:DHA1 family multidrug resistance protein-like MFS transporter
MSSDSKDIEKAELRTTRQISGADRRSSTSSVSSSASGVSRISITRQQTVPPSHYDPTDPTVLERHRTAASIYENTVGSALKEYTSTSTVWPEFGGGKPYPPPLPPNDQYVVDFTGPDDPLHGTNWPIKKK